MKRSSILAVVITSFLMLACHTESIEWPAPTQSSKPWTRWWWMNNAVDRENLSREINEMAAAGIGGVEITPIYGVKGEEGRTIEFLSPGFTEMIDFVCEETTRLGMGVDLPPGSGWRCGGPFVPEEKSLWNLAIETKVDPASGEKKYSARAEKNQDKVKRPASGGEGWTIDTYNKEITEWYLGEFWNRLGVDQKKLRCFFHDSFEYTGDFNADFMQEFKDRRGYDLNPYLYVLAGDCDDEELNTRIRSDYRETLADLVLESFIEPMTDWAHQHGSLNRNQAHGSPGNILDLYAACDIPETEFFGHVPEAKPRNYVQKFASSAAHVTGQKLVSSESFTWLDEHWTVTPQEMINASNQLLLAGINHMFFHGTCYSPADAEWPGWLFYASTQMNDRNPLWHEMPALFQYIQRIQSIQQASAPVNDLLVYWPYYDIIAAEGKLFKHIGVAPEDGWFYESPLFPFSEELAAAGYTFDYISDKQIQDCRIENGVVVTSGNACYQSIVVPPCERMPLATIQQLKAFQDAGGKVIFEGRTPQTVPGFQNWEERQQELVTLVGELPAKAIGKTLEILTQNGILAEKELLGKGFYFQKLNWENENAYLVFNFGPEMKDAFVKLNQKAKSYVILDPMSGEISLADTGSDGVRLQVQPGRALIVRCTDRNIVADDFNYIESDWKKETVGGRWHLAFWEGGPVYPGNLDLIDLVPWNSVGDAETRRFAGTVRYSVEFSWEGPSKAYLDLGKVLDCASVVVNEKEYGTLLGPRFGLFVDNLKPGLNKLQVQVTNVAANRISDLDRRGKEWRIFNDINFVNIDYEAFDASNWKIRDAGLLGPVSLSFQ